MDTYIHIYVPVFSLCVSDTDFWTRNFIIYEQPALTYQQKLIVFFQVSLIFFNFFLNLTHLARVDDDVCLHYQGYRYDPNSDSRNAFELAWTTSQDVNDRLGDTAQRIPQVRVSYSILSFPLHTLFQSIDSYLRRPRGRIPTWIMFQTSTT